MVLVLGVGAQETAAALRVFVGDRQANDASVKIPHLHEVIANDPYVSQSRDHSSPLLPCTRLLHLVPRRGTSKVRLRASLAMRRRHDHHQPSSEKDTPLCSDGKCIPPPRACRIQL